MKEPLDFKLEASEVRSEKQIGELASLTQDIARKISSIKNAVNKTQEFVVNVQASLDALVKQIQGVEDRVSPVKNKLWKHPGVRFSQQKAASSEAKYRYSRSQK